MTRDITTHILIVDDDRKSLLAMDALLSGPGRTIVKAESGRQALRYVLEQDFAVILLDVRMPILDGFETADLIRQRERSKYTPIIFLSAVDTMDADVFRGLACGAVDYLFKPVVPEILRTKVDVFVELHRLNERLKQRAVHQSEERFRLLVESTKDYAIVMLDPEGRVASWNAGAEEITGYDASEILMRSHACFYTDDDRASGCPDRALDAATAVGRHEDEGWRVRKDGTPFWANVVITALKDEAHRVTGFANVMRDLTERKRADEQLRRFAAELEARVEERTEELVKSQHRLRTLASELCLAEQRERKRLSIELHDYLAQLLVLARIKLSQVLPKLAESPVLPALREADQALETSLSYTRSLVAELTPPVLHEFGLIMAVRWLADQMQRHGLHVQVELGTEDLTLPEDEAGLLYQSLRELLINVVKHAESPRATVIVHADRSGELQITVKDEGRGFDPASLNEEGSFNRFGLFSIRERLELKGGRVHVVSAPGQGSAVSLVLPLSEPGSSTFDVLGSHPDPRLVNVGLRPSSAVELRTSNHEPRTASSALRVLVVDDHAMMRQGLCGILQAYGDLVVVGEAGNGEAALTEAATLRPDVVVMDVNMPVMDGIEATKRITGQWPAVTVIGLSVHTSKQVEEAMREAGAAAFVSKESAGEQLYATIVTAVRRNSETRTARTAHEPA